MKRFTLVVALALIFGFALMSVSQAAAPPKDPLGVITVKKGQPIHIAYWMVVAGADPSLGIDTPLSINARPVLAQIFLTTRAPFSRTIRPKC